MAVLLDRREISLPEYADLHQDLQEAFPDREVYLAFLDRAYSLFLKKIVETAGSFTVRTGDFRS